jgi:hypothetical protein
MGQLISATYNKDEVAQSHAPSTACGVSATIRTILSLPAKIEGSRADSRKTWVGNWLDRAAELPLARLATGIQFSWECLSKAFDKPRNSFYVRERVWYLVFC